MEAFCNGAIQAVLEEVLEAKEAKAYAGLSSAVEAPEEAFAAAQLNREMAAQQVAEEAAAAKAAEEEAAAKAAEEAAAAKAAEEEAAAKAAEEAAQQAVAEAPEEMRGEVTLTKQQAARRFVWRDPSA